MRQCFPPEERRHLKPVFSGPDTRSALEYNNNNNVQSLVKAIKLHVITQYIHLYILHPPTCTANHSVLFTLAH